METSSLVSAHKSSDSFSVLLHPLVLLTISDYITRHSLRNQDGPIVGALLGQQNGREITLEHAFECRLTSTEPDQTLIDRSWFDDRLQQFKDVLKTPPLDLVGWFTIAPTSGPQAVHLPIHNQILHDYNESAMLLTFHPTMVADKSQVEGKLPLTIYESVQESANAARQEDASEGKAMDLDVTDHGLITRFRELPYTVETGEAEMISVDFVARGGGNATAVDGGAAITKSGPRNARDVKGKGKAVERATENGVSSQKEDDAAVLSSEDEELIASLTARVNAIKMLHSRIQLLRTYLTNLPTSYLTTSDVQPNMATESVEIGNESQTQINHQILRSIQALVNRLPLVVPADTVAFNEAMLAEKNDVSLIALLGTLNKSVKEVQEMGRKFRIYDTARSNKKAAGGAPENLLQQTGSTKSGKAMS
ncbi:MAG: hypothetical protein M1817_002060 [Caeruleum heppii]|nr:MAG: hypothetical protein M1817_002060 [Caeruleum heppii]